MNETMKHTKRERMMPTPVCLPRTLIEALDAEAERGGQCSRSSLIRCACEEFLNRRQAQGQRAA